MFKNLKLSFKLPAMVVGAAVAMGVGLGVASYFTAANVVVDLNSQKLVTSAEAIQDKFETYFTSISKELHTIATSPVSIDAAKEFSAAWSVWTQFGADPKSELHKAYIDENPHPAGEKHLLDSAETGAFYDKVHAQFHPNYRNLMETSGYYDVFIFDTDGNLVYSVFKELDYATNFSESGNGQWKDTGLGEVFRRAIELKSNKEFVFTDFAPYGPSDDAPASFIASPIIDNDGTTVGVLAFQMPVDLLNSTFNDVYNNQTAEEAFLIGRDGRFRNDSPHTKETDDILNTTLPASVVEGIFNGTTLVGESPLHHSDMMSFVARTFEINDISFAVVASAPKSFVLAPVVSLRNWMIIIGGVMLVLAALFGVWTAHSIIQPMNNLVTDMKTLAGGKTDVALECANRTDEIGDMSNAVVVFRDSMIERHRLEAESRSEEEAKVARQNKVEALISTFKDNVKAVLSSVESHTEGMTNTAHALTSLSQDTQARTAVAADASHNAANNVQTVAAAAEELTSSIDEISRQVGEATGVVGKASDTSKQTNVKVENLAKAANKIGDVVSLISDIAEQTNLLALNATIESARAGDAGKGFAVVAQEVKALATQTGKATEEIASQIKEIQSSTQDAVASIDEIARTMVTIDEFMASITSSVEQQGTATGEISHNVAEAAEGTESVAGNIEGVQSATSQTAQSAGEVTQSAGTVRQETHRLNTTIERFLEDVAAA